ncbi:alpha/beta fold hydrolase [Acuticoccus sp. I52.16.1]|uniref:alpha/beta fold hydrolase n=1 Tax=Acuticoccus sp. I52.16.1 TaxID=2928472 RepID=UPI001FD25516|nr:alpha/beta hydrolase [Acuticoccus sp. I52.16.1]UOM33141.1 alpha/beta hydrolase [Acuticoccus sp. I52.16.1]
MATFTSDGLTLDYADEGEGAPVLMIHGFASNKAVNWANTSWVRTIVQSGRRAIRIDNRGHGASEKVYDADLYRTDLMGADAIRLLDHLGIEKATLFGYSMGARIAAFAALGAPERVSTLVLSGMASALVDGHAGSDMIAGALKAPSRDAITDPQALTYRVFAEQTGSDLAALSACIQASRQVLGADEVARIAVPTLVVAGSADTVSGSPEELAALIPDAEAVTLEGKDHMTAVGDREHKAKVLDFLERHGA